MNDNGNNETPKRVVIITGISPLYDLSENAAYSIAASGDVTHLALLGTAQDYIYKVQTDFSTRFPNLTLLAQQIDITSSQSVAKVAKHVASALGPWDVFIHNPTAHPSRCPDTTIREADEDLWWDAFERNVRSLYCISRYFFKDMGNEATFLNVVRSDLDGGGIERDSAGNASGIASAKVVEYLSEENEEFGLKVANIVALPEDQNAGEFISWATRQRSVFTHTTTFDVSAGIGGYETGTEKLGKLDTSSHHNGHDQSLLNGSTFENTARATAN